MVLGRPKPDGTPYVNDNDTWEWLQGDAAKAARFLGYLPFDQITDQRNAEPVIRIREAGGPDAYITSELNVSIPEAWELQAQVEVEGYEGIQPYRLALVSEKSSLADILGPAADRYGADLYLPTGKDGATSWVRCNAWRDLAEHVCESFSKGDRVIVYGTLRQRDYEVPAKDGDPGGKRTSWEVNVTDAGPSLKYAIAKVKKAARDQVPPPEDPWGGSAQQQPAPGGYSDEPPF
jgi:single-strand DNA-binding protein